MPARRRQNFPTDVRKAALERADGRCEKIQADGQRCPCALQKGFYQFAHIIADGIGGPPTLENCEVWCTPCHRADFAHDQQIVAQTKRLANLAAGLKASRRPMRGGVYDRQSRGMDGRVRDRDTGLVLSRPASIDVRDR